MYSRAEVTQLRQAFWTTFGQYMAPVPSAEGDTTNWINYKTGLKNVYFRMQTDKTRASIAIELTHPDGGIRELFWEQFLELKTLLHEALGEDWTWDADATDANGEQLSQIYTVLAPVNLFSRDDWPRVSAGSCDRRRRKDHPRLPGVPAAAVVAAAVVDRGTRTPPPPCVPPPIPPQTPRELV